MAQSSKPSKNPPKTDGNPRKLPLPEIYDELTAETSPGRNKLATWLSKAGASEMRKDEVKRIIAFALLSWEDFAGLRSEKDFTPEWQAKRPTDPGNAIEETFFTLIKWKDAAAYLVPKIREHFKGRDPLAIHLATKPKAEFQSDYDIQANVRPKMKGITDDQVTKRRQRLEDAQKRNLSE